LAVEHRKLAPARERKPITPRRGSERACDSTTPMPGATKGARAPAAMLEVVRAHPNCPVRRQSPAIEKVMANPSLSCR